MRLVCSLAIAAAFSGDAASQGSSSRPLVSEAQYEAWQTELSNWGRWGKDDQIGTLNLITPGQAQGGACAGEGGRAGVTVDEYLLLKKPSTSRARPNGP